MATSDYNDLSVLVSWDSSSVNLKWRKQSVMWHKILDWKVVTESSRMQLIDANRCVCSCACRSKSKHLHIEIHYVLSFFFFVKVGKERNNISAVSCFGTAETFLNCFLLPYPFHLPLPSSPPLITCVSLLRRLARCYDFCSCSDKVTRNDNLLGWQIESSTDRLKPGWICKCVNVTGQRVHSNSHAHI